MLLSNIAIETLSAELQEGTSQNLLFLNRGKCYFDMKARDVTQRKQMSRVLPVKKSVYV